MFHLHKWEQICTGVCVATHASILFRQNWTEDTVLTVQRCKKCGKERAYQEDMDGRKSKISTVYAKEILRYKE